jgi:hypothetical protein
MRGAARGIARLTARHDMVSDRKLTGFGKWNSRLLALTYSDTLMSSAYLKKPEQGGAFVAA